MTRTLGDVLSRVRAILGDPFGDWTTDAYLIPIVNHVYDLQVIYLSDTCTPYIEALRIVPNLPPGTTDLSAYQNDPNQPLYGLVNIFEDSIDWKPAGMPDNEYTSVKRTNVLPDVQASGTYPNATMYFEWREYIIYITANIQNIDIRVRGEFSPPALMKPEDVITVHPWLGPALVEEAATCAMRERANPGQMQAYQLVGTEALDKIANQLIRNEQGTTCRIGRTGKGRGRWNRRL